MKTKLFILSTLFISTLSFAQGSAGVGGGGDDDYLKIAKENPSFTHCEIILELYRSGSPSVKSAAAEETLRECGINRSLLSD